MYEAYLEKLKRDLSSKKTDFEIADIARSNAQRRIYSIEQEINKTNRKKRALENIEAMELPHRVASLATLVIERIDAANSLVKTDSDRTYFHQLSMFVKSGIMPTYMKKYGPIDRAHWIMKIATSLINNDTTKKGETLVNMVTTRNAEIFEEWIAYKA